MSDIKMTEVERFNKALISATDRLELEGHSDCSNELFVASNAIITTIESQKEEIEELQRQAIYTAYRVLKKKHEEDAESYIEHIFKIESQIESLKAITELAVKGLKDISTHISNFTSTQFFHDAYIEVKKSAASTLSEIERLQNVAISQILV